MLIRRTLIRPSRRCSTKRILRTIISVIQQYLTSSLSSSRSCLPSIIQLVLSTILYYTIATLLSTEIVRLARLIGSLLTRVQVQSYYDSLYILCLQSPITIKIQSQTQLYISLPLIPRSYILDYQYYKVRRSRQFLLRK